MLRDDPPDGDIGLHEVVLKGRREPVDRGMGYGIDQHFAALFDSYLHDPEVDQISFRNIQCLRSLPSGRDDLLDKGPDHHVLPGDRFEDLGDGSVGAKQKFLDRRDPSNLHLKIPDCLCNIHQDTLLTGMI